LIWSPYFEECSPGVCLFCLVYYQVPTIPMCPTILPCR
jgi:hypothetical protein